MKNIQKNIKLLVLLYSTLFFVPTMLGMHRFAQSRIIAGTVAQTQCRIPYSVSQDKSSEHKTRFFRNTAKKVAIVMAGMLVGEQATELALDSRLYLRRHISSSQDASYAEDEYKPDLYPKSLKLKEICRQETDQFKFIVEELVKDAPENQKFINKYYGRGKEDFESTGVIRCTTKQDDQECGILFYTLTPAVYSKHNEGFTSIESLGVSQQYRRQGIAQQMLSIVQDLAEKNGNISELCLYTVSDKKAVNCYKKFGFKEINTECYGRFDFNMVKKL